MAALFNRILLQYLIPIRLLHGALPSATLMDQHPRLQALYGPFLRASREGDVRAYDKTLANSVVEKVLITKGVYIAMERAREGCLRTLVRRLWLAKERSTRIPLESLHRALHWVGVDASIEEAEWYVATLIHKVSLRRDNPSARAMLTRTLAGLRQGLHCTRATNGRALREGRIPFAAASCINAGRMKHMLSDLCVYTLCYTGPILALRSRSSFSFLMSCSLPLSISVTTVIRASSSLLPSLPIASADKASNSCPAGL